MDKDQLLWLLEEATLRCGFRIKGICDAMCGAAELCQWRRSLRVVTCEDRCVWYNQGYCMRPEEDFDAPLEEGFCCPDYEEAWR